MTEGYFGMAANRSDSSGERAWAIDQALTWVTPVGRPSLQRPSRWLRVEQELIELHARYERACVED